MILYFGSPDCRSPLFQKGGTLGPHSQRGHRHICDTQRETAKYAKKSKGQQGEACAQEAARHDPLAVRNSERWVYGPSGCGGLEHRLAKFHQRICQTGECGPLSDEGRGAAAERGTQQGRGEGRARLVHADKLTREIGAAGFISPGQAAQLVPFDAIAGELRGRAAA